MPGDSAIAGTGVTYGSGGSVNPRFVNGSQNGGGSCADSKKDNLTGVEWLTNANEVCSTANCSWSESAAAGSAQKAVSDFNTGGGKCGYTDWRLPTENELLSLLNYAAVNDNFAAWLGTQGFTGGDNGAPESTSYWSATGSTSKSNTYAWRVYFSESTDLNVVTSVNRTTNMYAWLVRGSSTVVPKDRPGNTVIAGVGKEWPATRFTKDATNNCVIDHLTGLMWPSNVQLLGMSANWGDSSTPGTAQYIVAQMNINSSATGYQLCGYTDWRLPSIKELYSLSNYTDSNWGTWMSNNQSGFTNFTADTTYWSSTAGSIGAWKLILGGYIPNDIVVPYDRGFTPPKVWAVRGGK